mmetsp:Transcript_39528/g.119471  ORF Transcript_39528/g.119471 Transcript_39528/m.119471 type:complete len:346 (+) Transcript_39528:546-1583(+)
MESAHIADWSGPDPRHQRQVPREHPEDRHILRDSPLRRRGHRPRRADRHWPDREEVRLADQDHRRPAPGHVRSAPASASRDLARVGAGGAGVGARLREGVAHGEELRRQHLVPLRAAGLRQHGRRAGGPLQGGPRPAQDQNGGLGVPAGVRRGAGQGPRHDRHVEGVQPLRLRQRRGPAEACGPAGVGHRRGHGHPIRRPLPHVLHLHGEAPPAHCAMVGGAPGRHRVLEAGRRRGQAGDLCRARGDDGEQRCQLQVRVARGGVRRRDAQEVPAVREHHGGAELRADRVHQHAQAEAPKHLRLAGYYRPGLVREGVRSRVLGVGLRGHGGGLPRRRGARREARRG